MKLFYNLPKSEEAQQFYTRYAPLVPTLDKLGYLAQIVSALTEFGIIYAIVFSSVSDFLPAAAHGVALTGAAVGTAFIEIGLRKFTPFAARAIIHRRWQGIERALTGFILAATVGLLIASGGLSFKGSTLLVEAVAPPAQTKGTAAVDSTAAADALEIRTRYNELIEAARQTATADILELDAELSTLAARERKTGQRFTTRKTGVRKQIESVKATRGRREAELKEQRAAELATVQADKRNARNDIADSNEQAAAAAAALVSNYGGGLAYFTLFCLSVFVVSVVIKELHHAGAGMVEQVEPSAFAFEAGPVAALIGAVRERVLVWWYGWVNRIEQTTKDAPEPIAAPILWSRKTGTLTTVTTQGVQRQIKPAKPREVAAATVEPARRQIGYLTPQPPPQTQPDASPPTGALTDCVKDASEKTGPRVKIGVCDHCGNDYEQRTTWQRFCQSQCRKDYHAAQHGGVEFDPTRKPWSNG